jgi:dTDP-4-amino-4,6-dideoxygalactose transaminase
LIIESNAYVVVSVVDSSFSGKERNMVRTHIRIPFNRAYVAAGAFGYVQEALSQGCRAGNGEFADRCRTVLNERYGCKHVFFTPSCTAALEFGAILTDLQPGDEVILPSYTFSSTVNAIVLRGARPRFCDVRPETMNMDPEHAAALINSRTRMLLPIDYAGIPCDVVALTTLARENDLTLFIDAAQSIGSASAGNSCGTFGDIAAFSFHETKNVSCGEGGALIVNREDWVERAHIIQEKGTDRRRVLMGLQDKYSWVDVGSSFLLSEVSAAILLAQLECLDETSALRSQVTEAYRALYSPFEQRGCLSTPHPGPDVELNHHAFFVIFNTAENRARFLGDLRGYGVSPYIGYIPLHSSVMGRSYGYEPNDLPITQSVSERIVRLPFYPDLARDGLDYCVESMSKVLEKIYGR